VSGLHLVAGFPLVKSLLGWAVAFLAVGVGEELFFRGYTFHSVSREFGFWPATLATAGLFSALHYFTKPLENSADAVAMLLTGVLLAISIRATGDLRFAIGFHAAVDYAGIFVYGAPNTGNGGRSVADHLLESRFMGPAWLTGGPLGIQASIMSAFALIAAMALLLCAPGQRPAERETGGTPAEVKLTPSR
jgi:hypothetical protein